MPIGGSRGTLGRSTTNHVFQSLAALSANLFIFPQWQGWDIKDDRLPEAELRPNRGAEAEGKNNFSFNKQQDLDRIKCWMPILTADLAVVESCLK